MEVATSSFGQQGACVFFWVGGNRRIDGGVTTRWAQSRLGTLQTNTTIKFWDSHRLKLRCLLPAWAPKFVFVTLNQIWTNQPTNQPTTISQNPTKQKHQGTLNSGSQWPGCVCCRVLCVFFRMTDDHLFWQTLRIHHFFVDRIISGDKSFFCFF